jgi:penicillin-binding protein 1C
VLFDLLEGLEGSTAPTGEAPPDDLAPEDLRPVEVCAYSGHVAGPGCPHRKMAMALRAAVPTTPCPYHVTLDVDDATGLALAPMCRAGKSYTRRRYMVWPGSVKRYLGEGHRELPEPPALHPSCREAPAAARLTIASPRANHVVLMIPGLAADKQEVPLEAETVGGGVERRLDWFVDGAYLGRYAAAERVWWSPAVGEHEITVTDGTGQVARRKLIVKNRP